MAVVENLPSPGAERPIGFGRLKRKEDERFIRGQGTYLDDIELPGMLHGALLRSPYAHARIVSIDTSKAPRAPQRRRGRDRQGPRDARARVDADDLLRHPGRARGRQGPVPGPGGRVRDRDRQVLRRDALSLIDVEYEPLPAGRRRAQGARPRRAADPRRQGRPARQPRHPAVGGRRRGGDRQGVRRGRHRRHPGHHLPALPPRAARDVRDHRRLQRRHRPARHLQRQPGAARPPHGVRARRGARRAHDPDQVQRHRRRVREQGAGLPGLRVRDRRLDRRRGAGQVGREPVREPDVDRVRPRLHHACGDLLQGRQGHGLRVDTIADHGAFDSTAQPTKFPAGFFHIVCGSYDLEAAHVKVKAVYSNKAPAGSRTGARSGSPRPSTSSSGWSTRSRAR